MCLDPQHPVAGCGGKGLTEDKASTPLVGSFRRNDLDAAQLCTINYPLERSVPLHAVEKIAH